MCSRNRPFWGTKNNFSGIAHKSKVVRQSQNQSFSVPPEVEVPSVISFLVFNRCCFSDTLWKSFQKCQIWLRRELFSLDVKCLKILSVFSIKILSLHITFSQPQLCYSRSEISFSSFTFNFIFCTWGEEFPQRKRRKERRNHGDFQACEFVIKILEKLPSNVVEDNAFGQPNNFQLHVHALPR